VERTNSGACSSCLQPLERGAGGSRRQVQAAGGGRQAARIHGADKDFQVLQGFHLQILFVNSFNHGLFILIFKIHTVQDIAF
jgi:hypothetical protein